MNFYLPNNLNIEKFLVEHPPEIEGFDKWKLLYFVHLVSYLPSVSKKLRHEESGFVNLSSVAMQQTVHNYKEYLAYLLFHNILEVNPSYRIGYFTKSYRLAPKYSGPDYLRVTVENPRFGLSVRTKMGRTAEQRKLVRTHYFHLERQFDDL